MDIYNLTNTDVVTGFNQTFSPTSTTWLTPTADPAGTVREDQRAVRLLTGSGLWAPGFGLFQPRVWSLEPFPVVIAYVNSMTPVMIVRSAVSCTAWRLWSSVYRLVITDCASMVPFSISFT